MLIKPDRPAGSVILFAGGDGVLNLSQNSDGSPAIGALTGNFLVRTRQDYVDRGYMVALVDVPSSHPNGIGLFRGSAEHARDIAAVIAYMRQQANLPVWLVGTSAGSQSAANAAARLTPGIGGLVLTSSVTVASDVSPGVLSMNLEAIRVPALVMAHEQDQCASTPPADAQRIADRLTGVPVKLVTMLSGGLAPIAGPCEGRSQHGFFGLEAQAVETIAAFINANPLPPLSNFTALWWNPAESGWGINVNHQGDILFATLFTYSSTGSPMWLVMPGGLRQGTGNTFAGELYRTTGPPFNAVPFTPITSANVIRVGSMSLSFDDYGAATLSYDVSGVTVAKSIERQVYGTRPADCDPTTASRQTASNYQDLWWNAAESGWGVNVTHQQDTLFATLFSYDGTGQGIWLVMPAGLRQLDGSYSGELYRTRGPAFNAQPFTPIGAANITSVGTMRFRFSSGAAGVLEYSVDGIGVTKAIERQVFSSPVPECS
jgi:alpha/beta superfamily hydrolase